jgi:hypothetical protein
VNGRIHEDQTAEGRIAAVAKSFLVQMRDKYKRDPDYADFRDVLRPFVQREMLRARIDEARKSYGQGLTTRMVELAKELDALEFPDEFDLRQFQ